MKSQWKVNHRVDLVSEVGSGVSEHAFDKPPPGVICRTIGSSHKHQVQFHHIPCPVPDTNHFATETKGTAHLPEVTCPDVSEHQGNHTNSEHNHQGPGGQQVRSVIYLTGEIKLVCEIYYVSRTTR